MNCFKLLLGVKIASMFVQSVIRTIPGVMALKVQDPSLCEIKHVFIPTVSHYLFMLIAYKYFCHLS